MGYETSNRLINQGDKAWVPETGINFIEEDKTYLQNVQFGLKKSLDLTPRITADLAYEYEF